MNRIHACKKNSKNCVSTFNQEKPLHIHPASYSSTEGEAMSIMKELLLSMDRVSIEEEDTVYIRCIFQTKWLRFKDDVEIWFDAENKKVHIKSSSRMGYSDFGVNRKRAERILQSFKEKEKQHV
ncbi:MULTISPECIES: DUF1499 domain-containing protein [Bacillaceae]|uniref:DUF1499 domain-containing protein n=1 Tax=Metabacillus sediminis TaxID=3117746 RepID=A0ABZ2NNB3_9BACI|nr:DUF1499 domain-containing protein [Bacillus sp. SJS]KZZ82708.1 hypothetical protein AS29_018030 [Bacillus sp. SJS]